VRPPGTHSTVECTGLGGWWCRISGPRERTKSTLKSLTALGGKFERRARNGLPRCNLFPQCLSPELAGGWDRQVERLQVSWAQRQLGREKEGQATRVFSRAVVRANSFQGVLRMPAPAIICTKKECAGNELSGNVEEGVRCT
jgi:hypothetical protein